MRCGMSNAMVKVYVLGRQLVRQMSHIVFQADHTVESMNLRIGAEVDACLRCVEGEQTSPAHHMAKSVSR